MKILESNENMDKLKNLCNNIAVLIGNIQDEKAIPMGKDWSAAELPYRVEELKNLLNENHN
jgi:hypothetical protein